MAGSMGMGRSLGVKKFRINSKRGKDDPKAKEKDEREEREKLRSRKDKEGKDKKVKGATIPTGSKKSAPKKADEENDKKVKKSAGKETFHDTVKEEQGKNYSDSISKSIESSRQSILKRIKGKLKGESNREINKVTGRLKNFGQGSSDGGVKAGRTIERSTKFSGIKIESKRNGDSISKESKLGELEQKRAGSSLPDFPKARGASSGESASDRNPEPSSSVSSTSEKQRARNKGAELGR